MIIHVFIDGTLRRQFSSLQHTVCLDWWLPFNLLQEFLIFRIEELGCFWDWDWCWCSCLGARCCQLSLLQQVIAAFSPSLYQYLSICCICFLLFLLCLCCSSSLIYLYVCLLGLLICSLCWFFSLSLCQKPPAQHQLQERRPVPSQSPCFWSFRKDSGG